LRAWALHHPAGGNQRHIGAASGGPQGAVRQSRSRATQGDPLTGRRNPGAPARLVADQRAALPALLARAATHYSWIGDGSTTARGAALIKEQSGVRGAERGRSCARNCATGLRGCATTAGYPSLPHSWRLVDIGAEVNNPGDKPHDTHTGGSP
jgi:hypothetical protein